MIRKIEEPLLDSTIIKVDGYYWLFCTKRGLNSNKSMFLYRSRSMLETFEPVSADPVVEDLMCARPAGYLEEIDGRVYRVGQVCGSRYGEYIKLMKIDQMADSKYTEQFVKDLKPVESEYSWSFHTINGLQDLTVVDGVKKEFKPFLKLKMELKNRFLYR